MIELILKHEIVQELHGYGINLIYCTINHISKFEYWFVAVHNNSEMPGNEVSYKEEKIQFRLYVQLHTNNRYCKLDFYLNIMNCVHTPSIRSEKKKIYVILR